MASVCIALHVHQPFVLRRYSVFDRGEHYYDGYKSRDACRRYATRSVLPTNRLILGLVRRHEGRFRVSLSVSGTALDLFQRYVPEVIESFQALAATGCVEFLGTCYHNALSVLYSPSAFVREVQSHRERIAATLGVTPRVFRHSELIYGDPIADAVAEMGFAGVYGDGLADVLATRTCSRVYAGGQSKLPVLLRNERLTRDVAERFADRSWDRWPLTAPRYAEWLARFDGDEELVNLVWDYATFGMDLGEDSGIFEFLRHLPEKVLSHDGLRFVTASEAIECHACAGQYRPAHFVSSTEKHGRLSAWLGNPMQSHATHRLFALEEPVQAAGDRALAEDWGRLQGSEYFEAMSTEADARKCMGGWAAAPDSPYDAYINYMNVLDNVAERVGMPVTA